MHKVFKPARKGDSLRTVYLYPDGHVVTKFAREIKDLETRITYVQIAERVDGIESAFSEAYLAIGQPSAIIALAKLGAKLGVREDGDVYAEVDAGIFSLHPDAVGRVPATFPDGSDLTFAEHATAHFFEGAKVALVYRSEVDATSAPGVADAN